MAYWQAGNGGGNAYGCAGGRRGWWTGPSRAALEEPMSTVMARAETPPAATVVLHAGGQYRASEKAVAEAALRRHAGVLSVEANPAAQTATVRFDPSLTSVANLRRVAEQAGFVCAGCNVPGCLCDPLNEPGRPEGVHNAAEVARAHEPSGYGEGGHAGHSMDQMACQMRNRFVLALVFTLAILAWSSVGTS